MNLAKTYAHASWLLSLADKYGLDKYFIKINVKSIVTVKVAFWKREHDFCAPFRDREIMISHFISYHFAS